MGPPVCEIELVEERAISIEQLTTVFMHAAYRCLDEGWFGKRPGPDGKWAYTTLQPKNISLYDLCSHVLQPATHQNLL